MKKILINLVFIFALNNCMAQNLVENFSFEQGDANWFYILTVDFYECGSGPYQEGMLHHSHGNCSAGVRFFHYVPPNSDFERNYQEYVCQRIQYNEMIAGHKYYVSFKYRLGDLCNTATNSMGIGFFPEYSTDPEYNRLRARTKIPELKNDPSHLLDNNDAYEKFEGLYTATGNEQWFAIGAFHEDLGMLRQGCSYNPTPFSQQPLKEIYYRIDEVQIVPCIGFEPEQLTDSIHISCHSQPVSLAANTGSATYLWSTGETTQSINVISDDQYVWVDVTKKGCTLRDSIELKVFSGEFDLGDDQFPCYKEDMKIKLNVPHEPDENVVWCNGATTSSLQLSESNEIWVTKSLGECSYTDTVNVVILHNDSEIYPNPVTTTFSFSDGNEVWVRQIVTEDGKYVFKGYAELSTLEILINSLPSADYLIEVDINNCRFLRSFTKIKVNH